MEKEELAVGDSTRLEIIFSTKRYNRRITKRPRITTNEGPPDKTVTIHANCVQRPDSTYPVVVKPYKLDISQFGERVRDRMNFTITNVSEEDVTLSLLAGMPGYATISLPAMIKAGQSGRGEIILNPGVLDKNLEKSFTFEAGGEVKARFTVPVKRSVKKPAATSTANKKSSGH